MLQTTLKSIKDDDEGKSLYEVQMELVDIETVKIKRGNDLDLVIQRVAGLRLQLDTMRPEVERLEQRKVLTTILSLLVRTSTHDLNIKILIIHYKYFILLIKY